MIRRITASLLFVLVLLGSLPSFTLAQGGPPGRMPPRPAAADTSRFLPAWMHPFAELGGGWMVTPNYMRRWFQSGQGFAVGLAARPAHRLGVRAAIDVQMLPAIHYYDLFSLVDDGTGNIVVDSSVVEIDETAWSGMLRPELGFMVAKDLWLTAGVGGGYLGYGFDAYEKLGAIGPEVRTPKGMRNGWGWLWTAAARWDFRPADLAQLGVEVRANGIGHGGDMMRGWSIRVIGYAPEAKPGPRRAAR